MLWKVFLKSSFYHYEENSFGILIGMKPSYWRPLKTGMGSQILISQTNKKLAS